MVPEDLLFWIAPLADAPTDDPNLLCRRHADAMVVPRGWTLDDRREPTPRLFKPRPAPAPAPTAHAPRRRRTHQGDAGEQLIIDGTGEIPRPAVSDDLDDSDDGPDTTDGTGAPESPWQPEFDTDDDLGGLLQVSTPLLARAFRGTDRKRA
jgi:hypothetical protein